MNLVRNAFEAMAQGGRLEISTSCYSLDKPLIGYERIEVGDYVVLKVTDTGIGIRENDLKRIFEPFYTKKDISHGGSGLGLAVVYGVVRDHNGKIDVQTEVGKGTNITIYFPITRKIEEKEEDRKINYHGSEIVLVVDDLLDQRELACSLLSHLGYKVEAVETGRAAIEYLREKSVDIILLDMIMEKDFDGLDTYREILKTHPGQKAIITSGFSETDRVRAAQKIGAGQFIRKPYTIEKIGKAIRKELDRK